MESEYRSAVRTALAYGEGLELAKMLVSQMDHYERQAVIRYAGFLARREIATYRIEGQPFVIKDLPDSTIERVANSGRAKQIIKFPGRWSRQQPEYIVLQEAVHRGIQFQWWSQRDFNRVRQMLFGDCIDRTHKVTGIEGGVVCVNCQKRVMDKTVIEELPKEIKLL